MCAFVEMFRAMILENEFAKPKFYWNIFVSILSFTKYLMTAAAAALKYVGEQNEPNLNDNETHFIKVLFMIESGRMRVLSRCGPRV